MREFDNGILLKQKEVLDLVKADVTDNIYEDILQCIEESDHTYDYSIVDEPNGNFQTNEYEFLEGIYVDQTTNGGMTGDEFAGSICVQFKKDHYFKFYYSM